MTATFRYLLDEHRWIQKELGKAGAGLFDYHDIDKQIIEQNLFGVDINGASVGIAKLSLWLQTAKRDRPLSNLINNIKSANSLTSDWNELFPEIMADGGFDSTEFLVAKQFGYIEKFQGHKELKEYFRLIPFVFSNNLFDEVFQNLDNKREIYSFFYKKDYRILHILDENNKLVSFFVNSPKNFKKQLDKKFRIIKSTREGGYFSILSPAEPFWRQVDLIESLYQKLSQMSISQDDFIKLVDIILDSKEKIAKYNKHFYSLNAIDKIEIKEEIEKLDILAQESIDEIDRLVYRLYGLSDEEIGIVGGNQ